MESRVLPDEEVNALLCREFVLLKVDIDKPTKGTQKYLDQVQGGVLPFWVAVTPDGKYIQGTSGFRNLEQFKEDLKAILVSDAMRVPAAVEKALAKSLEQATKDLEAEKLGAVVRAAQDAKKARGWSDSKTALLELLGKAVETGRETLATAVEQAKGGDLEAASTTARKLQGDFKGTELESEAGVGVKCLEKFKAAERCLEKQDKPGARRCWAGVVKEAPDTPWAALAEEKTQELGE